ncbi:hypothetical protein C1646_763054 [Rhizophagus diaphanus]|nr:hypothetical protein C1646_763054 [Rhizophagus diaphanus] [Rhizophagus sp. MUCL 43196]
MTHVLIEFLQTKKDLELDDDLKIIRKEKINSCILAKYGIDDNGIGAICQFSLITPIEVKDKKVICNITNKRISIKDPLNTEGVLENIKENIYSFLIFYWNKPNDTSLIASLLNFHYKELDFVKLKDDKKRII